MAFCLVLVFVPVTSALCHGSQGAVIADPNSVSFSCDHMWSLHDPTSLNASNTLQVFFFSVIYVRVSGRA